MKTKTSLTRNSMSRSPLRYGLFFTALALACCALCPQVRATCQEGCLTNNNTVLGDDALLNNTGSFNTAIGANALISNTSGSLNTALGQQALVSNTTGTENVAIGDSSMSRTPRGFATPRPGTMPLVTTRRVVSIPPSVTRRSLVAIMVLAPVVTIPPLDTGP